MTGDKKAKKPGGRRKYIPSFARTVGRPLGPRSKALLKKFLPSVNVVMQGNASDSLNAMLGEYDEIWLEIGFGAGEHIIERAKQNPNIGFIGCEVYLHGVSHLLHRMKQENIENIRVFTDDARLLIDALPSASLSRAFILFPDPWPKKRHHKRRLITRDLFDALARVTKLGSSLHIATDHPGYAEWIAVHTTAHPAFSWMAYSQKDWKEPPKGHILTRYQEKRKAKHDPIFFNYVRE